MIEKVTPAEKLKLFDDCWHPRIVGELNGQHVKLVKMHGEFPWHRHDDEDELFLVLRGELTIRLRKQEISLTAGEFVIIPRGVEHQPVATRHAEVMLFEPASTLNTGNVRDERTVEKLERI